METKSRYEAINELQVQKRQLMEGKFAFKAQIKDKEKEIKLFKRQLEDKEAELKELEDSLESKELHYDGLIAAVDKGIEVFDKQLLNSQKK